MMKRISFVVAAGLFALTPSLANAFNGVLISCGPGGTSNPATATLKPGLTCTSTLSKIAVTVSGKTSNQLDACSANLAAPWGPWVTGKWSKLAPGDAGNINKADVTIKASTFGSCDFTGGGTNSKAWGTGKVQFYTSDGVTKIPQGAVAFSGRVAGDLTTTSAQTVGIVTKGPGAGGTIVTQVPLDAGALLASPLLGCNTGTPGAFCNSGCTGPSTPAGCCSGVTAGTCDWVFGDAGNAACTGPAAPSPFCSGAGLGGSKCTALGVPFLCCTGPATGNCFAPVTALPLLTGGANGFLRISYDSNDECTAAGAPFLCCTGLGTGTCN